TIAHNTIMMINSAGKVIIGKPFAVSGALNTTSVNTPGNYTLYVAGGILTEQVRVSLVNSSTWADYVFANDYKLKPLSEVEQFVKENKHLPEMPSANEVKDSGIDVATMDATLLKKIEELTLYVIQLQKENNDNVAQIQQLQSQIKQLSENK
ncbi:MAG TPA: TMF family protein, partial [Bacteroidia bacterium]|nr:TMF family protein [Bacteroidia bacterium]